MNCLKTDKTNIKIVKFLHLFVNFFSYFKHCLNYWIFLYSVKFFNLITVTIITFICIFIIKLFTNCMSPPVLPDVLSKYWHLHVGQGRIFFFVAFTCFVVVSTISCWCWCSVYDILIISWQGDIATFELLSQSFHRGIITGMDVCIRKPLIATCGLDRSVRIWNYEAWWDFLWGK